MHILARFILCLAIFACTAPAMAGADGPGTIVPLYPSNGVKRLPVPERSDVRDGLRTVRNVSAPTLEIFRPAVPVPNGPAVIVAPGGGFMMLSYDSEGTLVARRLAARGITAFVLKYRVRQTPDDPAAFQQELIRFLGGIATATAKAGSDFPVTDDEKLAAADAARAVALIRGRAAEWSIDPRKIGMLGFSAGAFITTDVAIGSADTRPDFAGIIYGGNRGPVPGDAPPAFIAASADDPLLKGQQYPLFAAWRAAGRPAELHLFERGGHGYGLLPQGATSDHWIDEFLWWMESRGLIARTAPAA